MERHSPLARSIPSSVIPRISMNVNLFRIASAVGTPHPSNNVIIAPICALYPRSAKMIGGVRFKSLGGLAFTGSCQEATSPFSSYDRLYSAFNLNGVRSLRAEWIIVTPQRSYKLWHRASNSSHDQGCLGFPTLYPLSKLHSPSIRINISTQPACCISHTCWNNLPSSADAIKSCGVLLSPM